MNNGERLLLDVRKACTIRILQASGKKSLLLTGSRGVGKTTLLESLLPPDDLPGVRSFAVREGEGPPSCIIMEDRQSGERRVIGRFIEGKMQPCPEVLDTFGVNLLQKAACAPGEWAVVDEVGFLEGSSPAYCQALEQLFEKKRVLAVLRKATFPWLERLCQREDCLLLDLDQERRWAVDSTCTYPKNALY